MMVLAAGIVATAIMWNGWLQRRATQRDFAATMEKQRDLQERMGPRFKQ